MSTVRLDLVINQGETFTKALNWYGGGKVCKLVQGLVPGCPTQIQIAAHGLPSASDTPVFIQHVKGATRANTGTKHPALATYIDANTFYVAVDTVGQLYTPSTGLVTYFAPKNLTDWTARMHIREELDDTVTIDELVSPTDITISTNDARITITIAAATTAAYDFDTAVYDLELVDAADNVTRLVEGKIEFRREVTRQT